MEQVGNNGSEKFMDSRPVDRDVLVHDLLRDTTKARVYVAVLVEGPVQRQTLNEHFNDLGKTTIYQTF